MSAPPSGKSSRSTDVKTACLTFISFTLSATRFGSIKSTALGLPVFTATKTTRTCTNVTQNHKVAVSFSPTFTHIRTTSTFSQMVCNFMFINESSNFAITFSCRQLYAKPFRFTNFSLNFLDVRHIYMLFPTYSGVISFNLLLKDTRSFH